MQHYRFSIHFFTMKYRMHNLLLLLTQLFDPLRYVRKLNATGNQPLCFYFCVSGFTANKSFSLILLSAVPSLPGKAANKKGFVRSGGLGKTCFRSLARAPRLTSFADSFFPLPLLTFACWKCDPIPIPDGEPGEGTGEVLGEGCRFPVMSIMSWPMSFSSSSGKGRSNMSSGGTKERRQRQEAPPHKPRGSSKRLLPLLSSVG